MADKKDITKKSENISEWYNDVVQKAQLADYGPVKGTMIIRPYGYALWENVQKVLDSMFKEYGVQNAYFPLFIPMSFLKREKEHVEGFSPELAVVTIGGGEELSEPVVVRPTSETIMYETYAKWVQSWRDLPLLINQWNNVVRWEKRTYLFLRTSEFLWQEGHTAHATEEEAVAMQTKALEWYKKTYEEYYAMPVITGSKSAKEKFAGAKTTYTVEALMPDGKALQACTSHNLGQNFSKAFNISFQNKEGKNDFVWQTSWGFSTRSLGGLFLTHGDDQGLVLPPKLAPIKVAIIPVLGKEDKKVLSYASQIKSAISDVSSVFEGKVLLMDEDWKTMGWKQQEAELQGIPLRIIVGGKEVDNKTVTIKSRIAVDGQNQFETTPMSVAEKTEYLLSELQKQLYKNAQKFLDENTHVVNSYEEFKKIMDSTRGFIKALWCEDEACEVKIKEETKATTRCLPFDSKKENGVCIYCGKPAHNRWVFAQAY
ncbi:MAG TPA: proline--tRNA ligase [Patescibacteria group bacterium]|nr:proline--tRNA ligase [Patescibacteria group bacterium]